MFKITAHQDSHLCLTCRKAAETLSCIISIIFTNFKHRMVLIRFKCFYRHRRGAFQVNHKWHYRRRILTYMSCLIKLGWNKLCHHKKHWIYIIFLWVLFSIQFINATLSAVYCYQCCLHLQQSLWFSAVDLWRHGSLWCSRKETLNRISTEWWQQGCMVQLVFTVAL